MMPYSYITQHKCKCGARLKYCNLDRNKLYCQNCHEMYNCKEFQIKLRGVTND